VFRSRWYHLEVPRHLYHFTPATLRKVLDAEGFDVLAEYQHSPEHNWAGILGSLFRLLLPKDRTRGAWRDLLRAVRSPGCSRY